MMVGHATKDIDKLLSAAERADLEAYCKEQGIQGSAAEKFIENSLKKSKEADDRL